MGLTVALSNALSGMRTTQKAVDLVGRNVANAGTPGYHRQSLSLLDYSANAHAYGVRGGTITRAFDQSLQNQYTRQLSDTALADVRATSLDRLQGLLGKPGATGSLDVDYNAFESALQELTTSPENQVARSEVLRTAQTLVSNLNRLSGAIQGLRQEAESQIASNVDELNTKLKSLEEINTKLPDFSIGPEGRNALLDQRDRLVAQISELVDIRADYRSDGTVALSTRSGVGLLDAKASVFTFTSAGKLDATSLYNEDPVLNGVGTLAIRTASGLTIDAVRDNVFQSGKLEGLLDLRDSTLVAAQSQMDDIAAAVAQAMSTNQTAATPVTVGAATGFDIAIGDVEPGNDLRLTIKEGGVEKSVRLVRVEDASKLPMDFTDPSGTRVLGLSFAGGAAALATDLQAALGAGFTVSAAGANLRVLDDGAAGTTDVTALVAHTTSAALQGDGSGLSLFLDSAGDAFTNSLDGTPQKLGFAGRIAVNQDIVADSRLLVQQNVGDPIGDPARAEALLKRLQTMSFATNSIESPAGSRAYLAGSAGDIVSGAISHQGSLAQDAIGTRETHALRLETIDSRLQEEYGVDVNEEMARLLELQNAYAANARVISIVQDLLKSLMAI